MNKIRWMLLLIGMGMTALLPASSSGEEVPGQSHTPAVQGGVSPLVEEMVKLDGVFREVVSAVALGEGARVRTALETMHGTMEKTHEGVHKGTVHLRKNADHLDEFIKRDKAFHAGLEALARAAQKNDQHAMLSLTKELLDRCVGCHRDFR